MNDDKETSNSSNRVNVGLEHTSRGPLQAGSGGDNNNNENDHSGITSTTQWDTASILQAAARSILDEASPRTNVSDDDSCTNGNVGENAASPANLSSLQQRTIPALAEMQDRKRFVGCLAAVLASAYDYDGIDDGDPTDDEFRADSIAYLDANDHSDGDYSSPHLLSKGSFDIDDRITESNSVPALSQCHAGAPLRRTYSDECGVERMHAANRETSAPVQNRTARKSFRRRKDQARSRHLKRRYDVLSKLLINSADLLQLDKSQARAFLPLLAKLLVPPSKHLDKKKLNTVTGMSSRRSSSNNSTENGPGAPRAERETPGPRVVNSDEHKAALEAYSAAVHSFSQGGSYDFVEAQIDRLEHFRPFLEMLSPGAGIRCLIMLLMQHLLHSHEGYDARVRHVIKVLGVLIIAYDMNRDPVDVLFTEDDSGNDKKDVVALATRKFESLEHYIAINLLQLQREQEKLNSMNKNAPRKQSSGRLVTRQSVGPTREQIVRGIKIGGTAVVGGTIFAVTGGFAAPLIAAGIGAVAGGTAVAATAAAVLSSSAAVTAIFGVGGGGLVGYKMNRRTQGLTEFEFNKENFCQDDAKDEDVDMAEAELFSTICISGWLRDDCDFQRPWGVTPSKPPLKDRLELLERFYSILSPDHVPKCKKILISWQGEEQRLWELIADKYGRDPSHLFPLDDGPRFQGTLTLEQVELVHELFVELGYLPREPESQDISPPSSFERMRQNWQKSFRKTRENGRQPRNNSLYGPNKSNALLESNDPAIVTSHSGSETDPTTQPENSAKDYLPPKHLNTVWDYHAHYGGELYTVRWESYLLRDLCDSVADLAKDLVGSGAAQVLKHTALSTLMTAVALPYALVSAANMIDGTWTLAVERADAAGSELARSLLFSGAGNRPVSLVGYSFGARVIYSCLKELARYQEKWEDYRETGKIPPGSDPRDAGMTGEKFYKFMREPASIIEDAILCGLPNHLSLVSWKACRQVVAGRLVNCFSQKDLILSLMFQFKRLGLKPVCGTCPVNVKGVENIDVTDIIGGHFDYAYFMGDILKKVRHGQPFQSRPTKLFVPSVETTMDQSRVEGTQTK